MPKNFISNGFEEFYQRLQKIIKGFSSISSIKNISRITKGMRQANKNLLHAFFMIESLPENLNLFFRRNSVFFLLRLCVLAVICPVKAVKDVEENTEDHADYAS